MPRHNSQPIHNDGPFSIYTSRLKQLTNEATFSWNETTARLLEKKSMQTLKRKTHKQNSDGSEEV